MTGGDFWNDVRGAVRIPPVQFTLYRGFAVVLFAASLLKGISLFSSQWVAVNFFLAIACLFEIAIGVWLISGWKPAFARLIVLQLLSVFLLVLSANVVSKVELCSCFGHQLRLPLSLVIVIDLLFVSGFLLIQPKDDSVRFRSHPFFVAPVLAIAMLLLSPIAKPFVGSESIGGYSIVSSSEHYWLGEPLPLIELLTDPADRSRLKQGSTTLVVLSSNCSSCKDFIESVSNRNRSVERLVIVDLSGSRVAADVPQVTLPPATLLTGKIPVAINLSNGIVSDISFEPARYISSISEDSTTFSRID